MPLEPLLAITHSSVAPPSGASATAVPESSSPTAMQITAQEPRKYDSCASNGIAAAIT